MGMREVAAAMRRARRVFERRPQAAAEEDAPATARWQGSTRVLVAHAGGTQMHTDMPPELGGAGDAVTPGWLFRASIATCATTSIAMAAAASGIELDALEVEARSRSDARGMLGMTEATGEPVYAGPCSFRLHVRIRARGTAPEELRRLVESGLRCSPMPNALQTATPMALSIDPGEA